MRSFARRSISARFGHSDPALDALARLAARCDKGRESEVEESELPVWRRSRAVRALVAALVLLAAGHVLAEDAGASAVPATPPATPAATPDDAQRMQEIDQELERETEKQHQLFGLARARISYPLIASVGLGMLIGERSKAYDCTIQCEVNGWLASVEAGEGGVVWGLGPAYLIGELGNNKYFLSRRYMGYSVRGSVMRTWGETPYRPDHEWHAGIEGQFTVVSLNLSLGVYRRIGDHGAGEPWLVSGGIGWGF
jgi:hypothetical protein